MFLFKRRLENSWVCYRLARRRFRLCSNTDGKFGFDAYDACAVHRLLAGVTMIIGNTIALRQRNVKRMLAYSSIAHAGYVLVAFASLSMFMFEAIWFYLFAYVFMTIGAFAILQVVSQHHDDEDISIFAGLYRRSPLMAVAMTIFLLSLAGIPGTAGFIGK